MKEIDALLISDVHLGSKGCNADKLLEVLKQYEPKELIIVYRDWETDRKSVV